MPLPRGSRYENVPPIEGAEPPVLRPRPIGPATPVLEHGVAAGDRHDRLGQLYFNDDRRYWRIPDANPQVQNAGDLFVPERVEGGAVVQEGTEGTVILIPRAREGA